MLVVLTLFLWRWISGRICGNERHDNLYEYEIGGADMGSAIERTSGEQQQPSTSYRTVVGNSSE